MFFGSVDGWPGGPPFAEALAQQGVGTRQCLGHSPERHPEPCGYLLTGEFLQAHQLYGQLTGQSLRLGFDRERMWFETLRAGYSLDDVRTVIGYLQREIRAQRRNVGALKLSNLLQPDRFEEDLQISRLCLRQLKAALR